MQPQPSRDEPGRRDEPPARLAISGLTKSFGPNRVLDAASFEVAAGEIHALVGQNGSGKSTVAKILAGYQNADAGTIRVDGRTLPMPVQPRDLQALGVSIVHQDLGLLDGETVLDNICVGSWPRRPFSRRIDRGRAREQARRALAAVHRTLDLGRPVAGLSAAEKVTVAVARGLRDQRAGRGVMVFDESTRSLAADSLHHLYGLCRRMVEDNGSVLLISHNLEEVLALADRVTVLRDGAVVAAGLAAGDVSEPELVRHMLGRPLRRPQRRRSCDKAGSPGAGRSGFVLNAAQGGQIRGLSFSVGAGETVGIAGAAGSGCEELPALLGGYLGSATPAAGRLETRDQSIDLARLTPGAALRARIAVVPGDRHRRGLALALSMQDNITLPRVGARDRLLLRPGWQAAEARHVIESLDVRPADPAALVRTLSGGNQQKVLIGKWLLSEPELLVLHEPTQAVDVGARADIHDAILRAAQAGSAVVLVASDPAELVALCDRVLVLRGGTVAAELTGELTIDRIIDAVYPPRPAAASPAPSTSAS